MLDRGNIGCPPLRQMTKVFDEPKAINKIGSILNICKPQSILLLRGNQSYVTSGAEGVISPQLAEHTVTELSGFCKYPCLEDIEKTVEVIIKQRIDFILAVGGGTVMDTAKASSILCREEGHIEDYVIGKRKPKGKNIKRLLIPTTAGTGAEFTPFAVVYVDRKKYSLGHPTIRPDYAILAPELTYTLNSKITAETGCDALAQAIEGFWSVNATEESKQYSRDAIPLILENLVNSANEPTPKSRETMLRAAHLAGKSISIAKTTAAHALSYPLTGYHDIPHGYAVILTLPYFFPINEQVNEDNIQKKDGLTVSQVKDTMKELFSLLNVKNGNEARDKLNSIIDQIKLKRKLSDLGITKDHLQNIIVNGFNPQRVINNPVQITEEMVWNILKTIL